MDSFDLTTASTSTLAASQKINDAWVHLIECVIHDLKTPLSILRLKDDLLMEALPHLLKGYSTALEHQLIEPEVSHRYLDELNESNVSDIQQQIVNILDFLSLLHLYNEQLSPRSEEIQTLSAKNSILRAINTLSMDEATKEKLIFFKDTPDFTFQCVPLFIHTLLSNLLDNAYAAIEYAQKGTIDIWMDSQGPYHEIHIKDTSVGMNQEALARVFSRYFTKREGKTIPGLGFCRLALLQKGGDVLCDAVEKEYSHFVILLPKDEPPLP